MCLYEMTVTLQIAPKPEPGTSWHPGTNEAASPDPISEAPTAPMAQLLRTTDMLVRLAEVALAESVGTLDGRGGGQRTLIARKQLEINLIALRTSRGPELGAAWSLINEPPEHAFHTAAGVRLALDEVAAAIEAGAAPSS